jgi:branched-subunit amino acid transport protein
MCCSNYIEVKKMTWLSIIIAGVLTYLTRMTMIALVSRDMLGDKIKAVLAYVPSAVFPAIIFPAIFINDHGTFVEINDPKIFGAIVAIIVGYFSRNIILTILSGLISYWLLVFYF